MNHARVGFVMCVVGALLLARASLQPRPAEGRAEPPLPVQLEAPDDGAPLPAIPAGERYHPWLPPLHLEAVSMGTTRDGYLLRGAALPEDGSSYFIMPRQKTRELHYGSAGLVRALVAASSEVAARFPGSRLALGDLSAREGGDILWSVSHNNGRDADLAFYYHDAKGQYLVPEDFVDVNARGIGTDRRFRFDVARNWALVRALLESPDIQVQWMFIYNPLRNKLLAHARSIGEPQALIDRAAEVLGQPGDGAPHNDHLHLRIMCSDADLREGCRDMGRIPSFVREPGPIVNERIARAMEYLEHPDPERRARAAVLLGLLEAEGTLPSIRAMLADAAPEVRAAAARGLELLAPVPAGEEEESGSSANPEGAAELLAVSDESWTLELARRLETEADPAVIEAWVGVLVRQGERAIVPRLEAWLKSLEVLALEGRRELSAGGLMRDTFPGVPPLASRGFPLERPLPVRLLAVSALEELGAGSAVPGLIGLLEDPDPEVRQTAGWALEGLANRRLEGESGAAVEAYARWFERNGDRGREAWLTEGFRLAGFPIAALDASAAPALVKALGGPAPVALNAHRTLCRISGSRPPETTCTFEASQLYWERWLRRHRPVARSGRR